MSGAGPTLRAPQPPATLRADSQQTVDVVDTYSDVDTLHWRLSYPFHTLFYSQKRCLNCILSYFKLCFFAPNGGPVFFATLFKPITYNII